MSQQHTCRRFGRLPGLVFGAALLLAASSVDAQWLNRPAPPMPVNVFREAYTGSVAMRLILNTDGTVRDVRLIGSSGKGDLDQLAISTVRRWRLDPTQVRPSDLTEGRGQIVGFRQHGTPPKMLPPDAKAYWALLR